MKFQLVSKHCLITGLIQQTQLAKDKKYTFCFLLSHFDVIIGYVKLKMKACYNDLSRRQFPNCPVTLGFILQSLWISQSWGIGEVAG